MKASRLLGCRVCEHVRVYGVWVYESHVTTIMSYEYGIIGIMVSCVCVVPTATNEPMLRP